MYLARAILNTASREVRRDLADPVHLHRTIMRFFPDALGESPRKAAGVLHRIDRDDKRGEVVLFMQSVAQPDFSKGPPHYFAAASPERGSNPQLREVSNERETIHNGDDFFFRLRANATRRVLTKTQSDGQRRNGTRVPVRGDEARLAWLQRRGELGGFRVVAARVFESSPAKGHAKDAVLTFGAANYEGHLVVEHSERFQRTLADGIGPGKAFGFGLLSLRKAVRG